MDSHSAPVATDATAPAAVGVRPRASAGSIGEVGLLAFPIVLTQLSQTTMHVVDSIFVGRLGAAELGGLGFAGIWLWTVASVFNGLATGVQTFVSQHHGAGEDKACGGWLWQGIYAAAPAAALSLFGFAALSGPLWSALGTAPEIQRHATDYVHVRPIGLTAWCCGLARRLLPRLRRTRTPLVATVIAI